MMQAQQAQSESEGKVATLTEKLKDMMHRFAELKSKSAAQLQQAEDKYRDLTKIAQAKVGESSCTDAVLLLTSTLSSAGL
jgi:DNA anti-recombination protein RmuC